MRFLQFIQKKKIYTVHSYKCVADTCDLDCILCGLRQSHIFSTDFAHIFEKIGLQTKRLFESMLNNILSFLD